MILRIGILLLIAAGVTADGNSDGRRGNEAFGEGDFQSAAEAYQQGLLTLEQEADARVRFGLTNNLGAAQYRLGNAQDALEAFSSAARTAPTAEARALADYNAGNAAFKAQDLQRALAHYRRALLENPNDPQAKFNYEFVKRKLQEQGGGQQQQQQQQGDQQQEQQEGENESQQNEGQNQGQEGNQDQQEQDQQGQQQQEDESDQQEQNQQQDSSGEESEPSDENPQQEGAPQPDPTDLSKEQAERILQALENEEAELLREVQRMDARPRRVEKDW